MSYRIDYHPEEQRKQTPAGFRVSRFTMTMGCFAVFLVLVHLFWQEGAALLRQLLIPGDPDVTLAAADVLADSLSRGANPGEAITVFCRRILDHGTLP